MVQLGRAPPSGYHVDLLAHRSWGETPRSRFLIFAGLYFAQGVPWGFFTIALQLRLTKLGLTPGQLGSVMTLAWLPWAAKPLLGPVADRVTFGRFGRRRPFILLAEAGMALSLVLLALVDPGRSLPLFGACVLLHNVFAAAQDVGVDALAIDTLSDGERGRANGLMTAGKYAGMVAGGQGLSMIATSPAGWPVAFAVAVLLLLLPATLIVRMHEAAAPAAVRPPMLRLLRRSFLTRVVVLAIVFAFIADPSDALLSPMMFPLFQRRFHYGDQWIATLSTLSALLGVAGSLAGGALGDRVGRRRAMFVACLGVAATNLIFAAGQDLWPQRWFVTTLAFAGAITSGMALTTAVALFMDLTNRRLGATQFQVYMSVANLRSSAAMYVGGHLADHTSPAAMFGIATVLELIPLALLPTLDAKAIQRHFAADDPA